MKKIWKLYIIFVVFFLLGDIGSTYISTMVTSSAIASKVALPEECICTVPASCDTSPIIASSKSNIDIKPLLYKLLFALIPIILIKFGAYVPLALVTFATIFVTFANLAATFFPLRYFFLLTGILLNIYLAGYFLEEKK